MRRTSLAKGRRLFRSMLTCLALSMMNLAESNGVNGESSLPAGVSWPVPFTPTPTGATVVDMRLFDQIQNEKETERWREEKEVSFLCFCFCLCSVVVDLGRCRTAWMFIHQMNE